MKFTSLFMAGAAVAVPFLDLEPRQAITNIDKLMKEKGKLYFGTCADRNLLSNAQNTAVISATFGQLTPENSMKWDQINAQQNSYNWQPADFLMDYAEKNNLTVRGHTLVWHSQLAGWVNNINDRNQLTKVIEDHVAAIVGRWKGKIRAWVCNTTRSYFFAREQGESRSLRRFVSKEAGQLTHSRTSSTRCSTRTDPSVNPSSPGS